MHHFTGCSELFLSRVTLFAFSHSSHTRQLSSLPNVKAFGGRARCPESGSRRAADTSNTDRSSTNEKYFPLLNILLEAISFMHIR